MSPAAFASVHLGAGTEEEIRRHARTAYPEEACGVLVGPLPHPEPPDRRVARVRAVANRRADERERRYLIPSEVLRSLERELDAGDEAVLGFYHSHPDHPARPSEFDREHAWPWYAYLVLSVERGEPRELGAFELEPEGRVFQPRRLEPLSAADPPLRRRGTERT